MPLRWQLVCKLASVSVGFFSSSSVSWGSFVFSFDRKMLLFFVVAATSAQEATFALEVELHLSRDTDGAHQRIIPRQEPRETLLQTHESEGDRS